MDLNLSIYDNGFDPEKIIIDKINFAANVGYKKIALSVEITGDKIQKIPTPVKINLNSQDLKVYTRLTVKVDEVMQLYHLSKQENYKHYDILAVQPVNEKMLNYINSGNFDCDIITFDFTESRIVNAVKKANFSLPITKGIGIEINYSSCLSSSSQRRQTLACGQVLVDKTNAKNIIISSGTGFTSLIRSAKDVVYMGLLFGLEEHQSKKAVHQNGMAVLKHSELRRNIASSIIEISMVDRNIYEELKHGDKRDLVLEEEKISPGGDKKRIKS